MKRLPLNFLNPLNPKSNQQLISLQITLAESSIQGLRMKEMMAIKEALLVITIGNMKRTVWRLFILMLGYNGLN